MPAKSVLHSKRNWRGWTCISALTESQIVAAILTFIVILFTLLADVLKNLIPSDHTISVLVLAILALVLTAVTFVMMKNWIVSVVCGVICFGGIAATYFTHPTWYDGLLTKMLGWASLISRFDKFMYGMFDGAAYVFYFSISFLFVFLTIQAIKKRRWS